MSAKPYLTSNALIATIKRKISMPLEQGTYLLNDILAQANDEMMISSVPAILEMQEEYFVFAVRVPLVVNQNRYSIPDRAIGMKLRDVMIEDLYGNLGETVRVTPDDKAYWQSHVNNYTQNYRYYIEGNYINFLPTNQTSEGNIVFYIYLRPNQLVLDDRAIICSGFSRTITVGTLVAGDALTVDGTTYTAVDSSPSTNEFVIGATPTISATNLSAAISGSTTLTNTVTIPYTDPEIVMTSNSSNLTVAGGHTVTFTTDVPTTWQDPDTLLTEDLFTNGSLVDFLQTKAGHRTYGYDIEIPTNGISGSSIYFDIDTIPDGFSVGDYICLANECIIPQIPPDLHSLLAERTGAAILASIGDQAGLQVSMARIAQSDSKTSALIDNRVTGSPMKVSGRKGLLHIGKSRHRRTY